MSQETDGGQTPRTLWSYGFIVINLAALFAFSNIAVFYSFAPYLQRIGIPPAWHGLLLSLEPMAAFALRPVVSPLLTLRNAAGVLLVSMAASGLALALYPLALTVPAIAVLRLFHGAAFVTLVSAATAILVHFVPQGRSAQAFGVFTVMTQLPFALMPLLVERIIPATGNAAHAYALVAPAMLPAMLLAWPLLRTTRSMAAACPHQGRERPSASEIAANLRRPGVAALLAANLLVFLGTTSVYFFMKERFLGLGLDEIGLFFSVVTGATISVRLAGAPFFDRLDKRRAACAFLLLLAASLALLGRAASLPAHLVLAACYGLAQGVALPLLSSAMFLRSASEFRGLSSNLMLFMMDAGFFFGPLLWAGLLAGGMPWGALYACAALPVVAACAAAWAGAPGRRGDAQA